MEGLALSLKRNQKRFNELKALFVARLRPKLNIPEMDRIHREIAQGRMDAAIWSMDEPPIDLPALAADLEKENRDGQLRLARESIGIGRKLLRDHRTMESEQGREIRNEAERMILTSQQIMEATLEQIEQNTRTAA
ncbi:hypothetical protein Dalk_2797 [Desulfatibacillum aliphaticivorans]|uniref:Uncharacterized protein n=1 Tax=Desulfatibacillum aliphaticivorans TaxID=218208 RepID=B8FKW7_DESAL|nr:hypothetical protein Dalk_2797 [Desulfatibacillum aliphaticivorans]